MSHPVLEQTLVGSDSIWSSCLREIASGLVTGLRACGLALGSSSGDAMLSLKFTSRAAEVNKLLGHVQEVCTGDVSEFGGGEDKWEKVG